MRLVVTSEHRFAQTPDGRVWTNGAFSHSFWNRYRVVFDEVRVVARIRAVDISPVGASRCDGAGIAFVPLPFYVGPGQFLRQAPRLIGALRSTVSDGDAVMLRIPSAVASMLEPWLGRERRPYGVEVVGDPREVFARGGVRHVLRPLFRWWFTSAQLRQCWKASAAAYVTSRALQVPYPCRSAEYAISDVEISNEALAGHRELRGDARLRLILVGSLEQYYKAPDVVITAVADLVRDGHNLELVIVGEGKYRRDLEGLAHRLGVGDRVAFRGMLPAGQAVRDELDAADLFVLPSRTEGLPRAMIEAMARRLPCIGSSVGGIPELLLPEDLVSPGDAEALVRKIREVMTTPGRMQAMSERNYAKAHEYHEDILRQRRREFYTRIRLATEAWAANRTRPA